MTAVVGTFACVVIVVLVEGEAVRTVQRRDRLPRHEGVLGAVIRHQVAAGLEVVEGQAIQSEPVRSLCSELGTAVCRVVYRIGFGVVFAALIGECKGDRRGQRGACGCCGVGRYHPRQNLLHLSFHLGGRLLRVSELKVGGLLVAVPCLGAEIVGFEQALRVVVVQDLHAEGFGIVGGLREDDVVLL